MLLPQQYKYFYLHKQITKKHCVDLMKYYIIICCIVVDDDDDVSWFFAPDRYSLCYDDGHVTIMCSCRVCICHLCQPLVSCMVSSPATANNLLLSSCCSIDLLLLLLLLLIIHTYFHLMKLAVVTWFSLGLILDIVRKVCFFIHYYICRNAP